MKEELLEIWRRDASVNPPVAIRMLETLRRLHDHDAAACQWALSLLVFLWQAGGPSNRPGPTPSLLLVNGASDGSENTVDPLLEPLFQAFNHDPFLPCYPQVDESSDDFTRLMELGQWQHTLAENGTIVSAAMAADWERARGALYGNHRLCGFVGRFHERFGVLTPEDGYRMFSIVTEGDFASFQNEAEIMNIDPFRPPGMFGFGARYQESAVIGSIPLTKSMEFTPALCIRLGFPLLLGPYSSLPTQPLPYQADIKSLVILFRVALEHKVISFNRSSRVFRRPGVADYDAIIRRRLRRHHPNYEHFVLSTLRGFETIVDKLLEVLAIQRTPREPLEELGHHLMMRAARGIALGLKLVSYKGHGIEVPGIEQARWVKVLKLARGSSEPLTRRDLYRRWGMNKATLGTVLNVLVGEGLVRLEGKYCLPVPLVEFVNDLASDSAFPPAPRPPKRWKSSKWFQPGFRPKRTPSRRG